MDSFNIYKGYAQLNNLEDQQFTTTTTNKPHFPIKNKPIINIVIITITIIFFTLILGLSIATVISPKEDQQNNLNSATRSIQLVCNVTQYPNSCFSSLSSINTKSKPDPEFLFSLSLQAAIHELSKLTSLPESLSSRANDSRTQSALKDCRSLLNDAFDRVNQSMSAVKGHVAEFDGVRMSNVNTWISAAMTDQETCLDGLEEMGSTVTDEVRVKVHASKVCLSNSLAILANIKNLVEDFHRLI